MKDAWLRFKKNKASVTAAIIILFIFIFSAVTPFINRFEISDIDPNYATARPKLMAFERSGFWDGGLNTRENNIGFAYRVGIGIAADDYHGRGVTWEEGLASRYSPIITFGEPYIHTDTEFRDVRIDTYYNVGFQYFTVSVEQYYVIREWEEENGLRVIYPMIDRRNTQFMNVRNEHDANFWYRHALHQNRNVPLNAQGRPMTTVEEMMEHGLVDNYLRNAAGEVQYFQRATQGNYVIRVLYYNYYQMLHGHEPQHVLGAEGAGYDLWRRMSAGVMLSLGLATAVSLFNLTFGAFIGAMEGYYGGWFDLFVERIKGL
jgi:ABC-type dipeptide/oligopeptide/nickel transport system permease subunit